MSNQFRRALDEAFANAPLEPAGAYFEVKPDGPPETKRAVLRALVRRAIDAGLRIDILADEPTLADALMSGLREFEEAAIFSVPAHQPGYFRIKICRPVGL